MQVAAYCNGRAAVTEYDALLLEHVLWAAPETAPKIADWLLAQLAADDGMKQVRGPDCAGARAARRALCVCFVADCCVVCGAAAVGRRGAPRVWLLWGAPMPMIRKNQS